MSDTAEPQGTPGGGPEKTPRVVPMAALAGAVVLVGLVGFALYRRHATSPRNPVAQDPSAPAAGAPGESAGTAASGTMISATLPIKLTPETRILAERYRCVCGCNDVLSVCTCKNPSGSEEMKMFLQGLARERKPPEEIDRAMVEKFGPACLLSNPAPPQTLPSHAGPPPPAPTKKR